MHKIKIVLKKFLPPPVNAFMREVRNILSAVTGSKNEIKEQVDNLTREVSAQLRQLSKENALLQEKIAAQNEELKRLYALFESANRENLRIFLESKEERERLYTDVNKLVRSVPQRSLYNNDFERRITASFREYRQRADFAEKLLALLRGLDNESAETVTRILARQEKIWGTEGKSLDILTDEEDRQVRYLKQHFFSNIFKISDEIYCYGKYLLPINHFEPSVFADQYGLRKISDPEYFADKCIIDVGAFIGDSALIFSPLTSSKLYAFEATSKYYNLLKKTIKLNDIDNVIPIHAALGAECGNTTINVASSCSTLLTPNIEPEDTEEVGMITLDSFVEENGLEVGLIKVDIEGYEREFLKGAEKTIKTQRPTLIISIYHYAADFFEIKPTIESWNLGYSFKIHKPVDYSISREVLLIAEIEE